MSDNSSSNQPPAAVDAAEELLIKIPATTVHLIDNKESVELAHGDLEIILLHQNDAAVVVLARIGGGGDQLQWPLTKDVAVVKLDDSHYFFTLNDNDGVLNYGLTIPPSNGQEELLKEFDGVLDNYTGFSEQRVEDKEWWSPEDTSAATVAPEVEEYSGWVARMIAAGSGQLVKGILWVGDLTVDRLKLGDEFIRKRIEKRENAEISHEWWERIQRVKRMTKKCEDVANGVLSGVIKVSEMITGSVVNSTVGKMFFHLLPGEIILASLDSFNKVWDAVEVAGKKVLSTSSELTTELVTDKYGEEAGKATTEGLEAVGYMIGAAWAVVKLRKAINPKGAIKPTRLVKAAASKAKKTT